MLSECFFSTYGIDKLSYKSVVQVQATVHLQSDSAYCQCTVVMFEYLLVPTSKCYDLPHLYIYKIVVFSIAHKHDHDCTNTTFFELASTNEVATDAVPC